MKRVLVFLLLFTAIQNVKAQTEKDYPPIIRAVGNAMNLEKGKTLNEFRQSLLNSNHTDITQDVKPDAKNVCIMEGTNKGLTTTYEIYYLGDGRIYELVVSLDTDKEGKYRDRPDVKLQVQRIAFNNISNSLHKEFGKPTISIMDWEEPYTKKDWEDPVRTAAALMSNKLFILFAYVSSKYKDTEYKDEPSIYISLDPLMRVRMGVKDVELYKLLKKDK